MLVDILVMLETSEISRVEQDQDDNAFRIALQVRLVPMLMILVFNRIFFLHFG